MRTDTLGKQIFVLQKNYKSRKCRYKATLKKKMLHTYCL